MALTNPLALLKNEPPRPVVSKMSPTGLIASATVRAVADDSSPSKTHTHRTFDTTIATIAAAHLKQPFI